MWTGRLFVWATRLPVYFKIKLFTTLYSHLLICFCGVKKQASIFKYLLGFVSHRKIWFYQLCWSCQLATVKRFQSSDKSKGYCSKHQLSNLFTVANSHCQPRWWNLNYLAPQFLYKCTPFIHLFQTVLIVSFSICTLITYLKS